MGETLDETNRGRATQEPPAVYNQHLIEPPKGALTQPTSTKRSTPENGHSISQTVKRSSVSALYEEILQELPSEIDQQANNEDTGKEVETGVVDEDRYNYYVAQRKAFAKQASAEVATHYYPLKSPSQLTETEWGVIQPHINTKFRELLVESFPLDHLKLNNIYTDRR